MKKVLLVLAVAAIGLVSCKKEEAVKPVKVDNATMGAGGARIDLRSWPLLRSRMLLSWNAVTRGFLR